MTAIETLHVIVDADKKARSVYDEATQLRDSFNSYVEERVEKIRRECFAEADKKIEVADEEAVKKADEAINDLNAKLETELTAAREHYESKKNSVIEKIFKLAVDVDA